MKTLELFKSLDQIVIKQSNFDRYYDKCFLESWNEIKEILKEYDITFPDPYTIVFGNEYTIRITERIIGGNSSFIYFFNEKVAEIYSIGSNVCDTELKLIIYFDKLKLLYS